MANETDEQAGLLRDAALNGGGWMTAAVSGTALLASGVSLWETTIKQPNLKVYVTENLSYTRDPYGSYEVVAMPITIQNGGARDAAVISLTLDVKNTATGSSDRFISAFTADAQYFGGRDDVAQRIKRPKTPFAPIAIAGRAAYTGTILFYPPEYEEQRLLEPRAKVEMTLKLTLPEPSGLLERWLTASPGAVSFKADVPNYLPGALLTGDNVRLKVTMTAEES